MIRSFIGMAIAVFMMIPAVPAYADKPEDTGREHAPGQVVSAEKKKDKSENEGKSHGGNGNGSEKVEPPAGPQGKSPSDPDGDENGGPDKPGYDGGFNNDRDGNNGSGNDTDCEDDNRGKGVPGHCKDKPDKPEVPDVPENPDKPEVPDVDRPDKDAPDEPVVDEPTKDVDKNVNNDINLVDSLPDTGTGKYVVIVGLVALGAIGAGLYLLRRRS